VDNSGAPRSDDDNDGVTVTDPLVRPAVGQPWTIDDLHGLPDDGFRYEIVDGSLLVSPPPAKPHFRVTAGLHKVLVMSAPDDVVVGENAGIDMSEDRTTYRIPDIVVVRATSVLGDEAMFAAADVVLAIEVLSPDSGGDDQVGKRYRYGKAGIPHYWIIDPKQRTLTVLRHNGAEGYDEVTVVRPGETWQTDEPFPLKLDPADFV
jgi:Uma2 family endonuclease